MRNSTKPSIGFVGLGNMGGPMCKRLLEAGYAVRAFDLNAAALDSAVAAGASRAQSAADCAAGVDIFLTSLPRPDHVEAVMGGDAGALQSMRSGSVWVDLTTNRKELVEQLMQAAPVGVHVVDCPVTGAVDGARNGKLTLFIGGDDATVARVMPVLQHLGEVIHCGPLGTGNVVKLVTNQLWFIAAAAIGEGFATGIANGVELGVLWNAIKNSVGDSFVVRHDAPSIFAGHYDPSFSLDLCLKDLGLIQELGKQVQAELPMTDAARHAFATAAGRYGPHAAELHVAKRIEDDANLSMRLQGDWTPPWEQYPTRHNQGASQMKPTLKYEPDRIQIERRQFITAMTSIGITATLGGTPALAQESPKKGGTLRLGMSGGSTSDTLDPRSFSDVIPITYSSMFWNGLVEIDNQDRAVPELFESWEAKPGAAVWVFNVRRGITFTSGKTLDADDVIYSIGLHRGETRSPIKAMLRPITEIKKLTSHQIQFTLVAGNADLPFLFSSRQLIVVPNGTTDFSKPDGTGAFTLTDWQPGVRVVATRKPGNYWKPGRGNFDRVELLYIGDSSARTQALLTGRVDAINRLDPKTAAMMMQAPNIEVLRIKGVGNRFAFSAHRDKAPFDNLDVMLGLKYGIDRQSIVRNVFSGFAVVGNDHLITPGSKFFDSTLPQRPYDPERAAFHFKKAGISAPIELLVSEGAFPGATDSAVLFQESVRKAGAAIELKRVSSDGYWDNVWLKSPFCAVFWNPRVTADLQLSSTFLSDAPWNDTRWKRPDFDKIILAARSELDEAKRKKLYADAQRMIAEDGGMITFAVGDLLTASSKKLRGDAPDERYELNDMRLPEKGWFA